MTRISKGVEDAVDLALLLGDTTTIDRILGGILQVARRDSVFEISTLESSTPVERVYLETVVEFLESRAYATTSVDGIELDYEACISLFVDARRANSILDAAEERSDNLSYELLCTLPNNDPSFSDRDPVDFGMRQITSRLLDLCREATESITIVSPFLERGGVDWLLPGLEGALERGVSLTLVSRELRRGEPNYEAIRELVEVSENNEGNLSVYDYYGPDPDSNRPLYTLHSKVLLADENVAYIGSANFTTYGFRENLEVGVVLEGNRVEQLVDLFRHIIETSAVRVQIN